MIEQISQAIKAKDHATLALHGVEPVPHTKDGKTLYKYKFSDPSLASRVKQYCERQAEYFDGIQHVRKIALNSLYGATINEGSRYYRDAYGASTTGGGREITQHMIRTIGKELTGRPVNIHVERRLRPDGKQDTLYTTDCPNVIYSDTDSCYFATGADDPEDAVLIADHIAEHVNESFVGFVQDYFLVQPEFNSLIKVAREVVADRAVFIAKKKYLMHLYDKEGKRVDELKVQGAENKKSSTPAPIREFLNTITNMILRDSCSKDEVFQYVHQARDSLFTDFNDLIEMGVAQSANKIEFYTEQLENGQRPNIPGHVRAAIQYNECLDMFKDYVNPRIYGGDKIKVYHLEENQFKFKTLALPSDSDSFPSWFGEYFRLNKKVMEEKLIEKKLEKLFAALDWPLPTRAEIVANSLLEF